MRNETVFHIGGLFPPSAYYSSFFPSLSLFLFLSSSFSLSLSSQVPLTILPPFVCRSSFSFSTVQVRFFWGSGLLLCSPFTVCTNRSTNATARINFLPSSKKLEGYYKYLARRIKGTQCTVEKP